MMNAKDVTWKSATLLENGLIIDGSVLLLVWGFVHSAVGSAFCLFTYVDLVKESFASIDDLMEDVAKHCLKSLFILCLCTFLPANVSHKGMKT